MNSLFRILRFELKDIEMTWPLSVFALRAPRTESIEIVHVFLRIEIVHVFLVTTFLNLMFGYRNEPMKHLQIMMNVHLVVFNSKIRKAIQQQQQQQTIKASDAYKIVEASNAYEIVVKTSFHSTDAQTRENK